MGSRSATSLAIPEYAYIVLIVGIILVDVRESPWGWWFTETCDGDVVANVFGAIMKWWYIAAVVDWSGNQGIRYYKK